MDAREIDTDFELPVISPWRQTPSPEQKRYAADLARTELAQPQDTIDRLPLMSRTEVSALIRTLAAQRARRLRNAPRPARRNWRLAPMRNRR